MIRSSVPEEPTGETDCSTYVLSQDNKIIFLESHNQVDMKKNFKHLFGYFSTLETHSVKGQISTTQDPPKAQLVDQEFKIQVTREVQNIQTCVGISCSQHNHKIK